MLLTQGSSLLPATIHSHKKKEIGTRILFFPIQTFLVCCITHTASMQCCNGAALPGRAWFQHQNVLSNPASVTADDKAALSHKIWFLYLNQQDLWCFLLEVAGRRALLCPWSSASCSPALLVSEVFCSCCLSPAAAGCPLLSEEASSLAGTIDPTHLLASSSHTLHFYRKIIRLWLIGEVTLSLVLAELSSSKHTKLSGD